MSDEHDLPNLPPVETSAAAAIPASTLTPELLASLLADGDDELAAWTLRHALAERPRAEVYDGLLAGAMTLVGERWATGQWSVAEEHLASRTLLRALDGVRPASGPEGRIGPLAVLAGVAGEDHIIGLVCLEHVLAEAGWTVADLGADVPAADLGRFIARNDAVLVALTASSPDRLPTLADTMAAVRAARPGRRVPILLGGRIASRPGIAEAVGADWAGTSLTGASAYARRLWDDLTSTAASRPV